MEKIPHGRYTKEFREGAAQLGVEDGLSAGEASQRLSLPKALSSPGCAGPRRAKSAISARIDAH